MGRLLYLILIFEPIEYAPLRSIMDLALVKYQKGLSAIEGEEFEEEKQFLTS